MGELSLQSLDDWWPPKKVELDCRKEGDRIDCELVTTIAQPPRVERSSFVLTPASQSECECPWP
jgi:hypothetical protein